MLVSDPLISDESHEIEACVSKPGSRWLEKIGFVGVGAAAGAALALAVELTGHPWWALLIFLACAVVPSVMRSAFKFRAPTQVGGSRLSQRGKILFVLLMIAANLAIVSALGINPRDYAYTPLLPPVILAALLFGFGQGLFAVIVCTLAADYLFALPEFDFAITNIEDAVGLSVFAIMGALIALAVHSLVPPDEP